MLTTRQKQLSDFIRKIINAKGVAPSEREIARHFRISASTAHEHLETLKEKGYVLKERGRARGISVAEPKGEKLMLVPLLGRIAAGRPIEAIEDKKMIAVPQSRLPFSNGRYYALQVTGDSMIDANIKDKDTVLVKEQKTAENGQTIVALLDNNETTLKRFYKECGHIRLQPANRNYEPIIVRSGRDFEIQGVVIDTMQGESNIVVQLPKRESVESFRELPLNKVICGDAVKEIRKLPGDSCDIVIVDPPYNIGKDFGNNFDKREMTEYIRWCKSWIDECIRVMKPTGTMFIYGFSEILAYLSVEIPIQKRWLIWHYTNKNMASVSFWQRSHEAIICAWKGKPVFNTDEVREPYTEGFLNGAAGKIRTGKSIGRLSRSGIDTIYHAHENGALPRDVLKIPALAGGAGRIERWFFCKTCNRVCEPGELKKHQTHHIVKHPTQKPLELTKRLIKSSVPKGEAVILVPFVGSGSECVVAKKMKKSYIGFEINPDYVNLARAWLKLS